MLEVNNIHKSYEEKPLLKGISFDLKPGEVICLLGPSGGGKSTLLRIIAGLEEAEEGSVFWDGTNLKEVPVHRRNFGFMFQDYALFPHRTVAENIIFGMRMQNYSEDEIYKRLAELLNQVNLSGFDKRRVTDLSGGEQQRVALARALAPHPHMLMLDEPLAALDRALSEQLSGELRQLLRSAAVPAIYVTHDQQEAFEIADRLLLLHEGRIVQEGKPFEVYSNPANTWVANFFGLSNQIPGEVRDLEPFCVHTPLGDFFCSKPVQWNFQVGESVVMLIRPAAARLANEGITQNTFSGVVRDVVFGGETFRARLEFAGETCLQFSFDHPLQIGEEVRLQVNKNEILCLDSGEEKG